jgi:GT2 family glycosyltransferase
MPSRISGSIVLFKSDPAIVQEAVRSFLNGFSDSILYLIDNSPKDNLRQFFLNNPRIRYIFNDRNLGFGAAHNVALRQSINSSDYHVVLNPDVYFDPHVIPELVTLMDRNPEVGMVMPKVLYPDGTIQPTCRLLPSPAILFLRRFALNKERIARKNNLYELTFSGYNKIMDVPFLSGCFMMLRSAVLKEVGLFDENIFLYTEDIDLTRRIHRRYRTVFFPEVSIFHIHARGSYKSFRPFLLHMKSAITYFNKWGWFHDAERETINQATLLKLSQ